jgi:hypothetical protein
MNPSKNRESYPPASLYFLLQSPEGDKKISQYSNIPPHKLLKEVNR